MSKAYTRLRRGDAIMKMRTRLKARQERKPVCVRCGAEIVTPETSPLCHECVLSMSEMELESFYANSMMSV